MKICIFGAGAIGGYLGAMLARQAQAEVSLVARGAHLEAMLGHGLTLHRAEDSFTVRPRVSSDAGELGVQDFVILTLKAHAIATAIPQIEPLLGPHTAIVFAQNGLPWWYFHKSGGPLDGARLESADPGGLIWERLGPQRAIGAVVWQAAHLEAPGVVRHEFGDRMPVAEPDGARSPRVEALSKLLTDAGIKSPVRADLRSEIWLKLWGNLSFNPVSVLTGLTLREMTEDADTHPIIARMMAEAQVIAESLGVKFPVSVEERIAMAAKVGHHKTSMLQDVEAGRPTELEALLGSVVELARLTGHPAPTCETVLALTRAKLRLR